MQLKLATKYKNISMSNNNIFKLFGSSKHCYSHWTPYSKILKLILHQKYLGYQEYTLNKTLNQ